MAERPELNQFKYLLEKYPKTGIILVQQNHIKMIESYLNMVEDIFYYELDIDTENWRRKSGPHPSHTPTGLSSSNVQIDNFEARYVANQRRWYKAIAQRLDKLAKDQGWEGTFVISEGSASYMIKGGDE